MPNSRDDAPQPHSEEDGFGNGWECTRGLPTGKCGMQIVRPGKVQCDICDGRDVGPSEQGGAT